MLDQKWKLALTAAGALALFGLGARSAQWTRRRVAVNPPGTASGLPFSNGIRVGNALYVAGEQGLQNGKPVPGGIGPETQAALEAIQKIVRAGGMDMKDVVTVNVYLADVHDFPAMNRVYTKFFPDPKPARTTVQVGALVNNARVEISAIAVREQGASTGR